MKDAAEGVFHDVAEVAELEKARPGAEVQARPDEQQQHRQAPDQGVDLVIDGRDGLNKA